MHESVDKDVLSFIGEKFQSTLISLELRANKGVNDEGIIGMCQRLSGYFEFNKVA